MSSDIEKEPLSRQQKKSKETKARIFHAAKTILQKQGYDQLSIKNICDEAGVSNGSFYHHFKTKDDLLSYYIEEQPSINPDLLDLPALPGHPAVRPSAPVPPALPAPGQGLSDTHTPVRA